MLTVLAIWLALGTGLEIGHQIDEPSTRVVGVVGRVVAWPAAAVEKGQKEDEEPYSLVAPTGETI